MTNSLRSAETYPLDSREIYPKALYHKYDTRKNFYEISTSGDIDNELASKIETQAMSVACLVPEKLFIEDEFGFYHFASYTIQLHQRFGVHAPLGEQEKFYHEVVPGDGTAFLVGKRYVLTARHCICEAFSSELDSVKVEEMFFVFGFYKTNPDQKEYTFHKRDVYRAVKVIGHTHLDQDWALLELDRDVEGRKPLELDLTEKVAKRTELYMLGHPSGLPLKLTCPGRVQAVKPTCFTANLDAFGGNSGSPVFEKTNNLVVGILVEGRKDYHSVKDYMGTGEARTQAYSVSRAEIKKEGYEVVQRLNALDFVRNFFLASEGNVDSQYSVGLTYLAGIEIVGNFKRGVKWLRKAASGGHIPAHLNLLELGKCFVYDLANGKSVSVAVDKETKTVSFYMGEVSSSISITIKDFLLGPFQPSSLFSFKRLSEHDDRFLLFEHIRNQSMEEANKLFLEHKEFYEQCFTWEAFGLLVIETDHAESLRFIAEKGFSFKNAKRNPLIYAYSRKALDAFKALLDVPDVDLAVSSPESGRTFFHVFCEKGENDLLEAYCTATKKHNYVFYRTQLFGTPRPLLHLALERHNGRGAEILIEEGVPFEHQMRGWPYLMRDVKFKLDEGEYVSVKGKRDKNKLQFYWQVFTWDFDRKLSPTEKIALLNCCCNPHLKVLKDIAVKRVIERQIIPFDQQYMVDVVEKNNPIHVVLKSSSFTPKFKLHLMNLLLSGEHPPDINQANKSGETALILAAQVYSKVLVEVLQVEGIELNNQDAWGNTALHHAVLSGSVRRVKLLVQQKGIDLDTANMKGQTPYQLASDNEAIAKILREAGANNASENRHKAVVTEKHTSSGPLVWLRGIVGY